MWFVPFIRLKSPLPTLSPSVQQPAVKEKVFVMWHGVPEAFVFSVVAAIRIYYFTVYTHFNIHSTRLHEISWTFSSIQYQPVNDDLKSAKTAIQSIHELKSPDKTGNTSTCTANNEIIQLTLTPNENTHLPSTHRGWRRMTLENRYVSTLWSSFPFRFNLKSPNINFKDISGSSIKIFRPVSGAHSLTRFTQPPPLPPVRADGWPPTNELNVSLSVLSSTWRSAAAAENCRLTRAPQSSGRV